MNQHITPYSWIRSGAAVYLARLGKVRVAPGDPGQQITTLELRIEETLWGPRGDEVRKAVIVEPASATARMKFPDPTWGRVTPQEGALLLVVTAELGEEVRKPLYVEAIPGQQDPVLASLRDVLDAEGGNRDSAVRRSRYLGWLRSGSPIPKLFGAEALARDEDLPEIDPKGDVATAFAKGFDTANDLFVRMSLGEWMWSGIYPRTNEAGKVAILDASLRGAADPSEDVRRLCLDKLAEVGPRDLELPGLIKVPAAVPFVEERLAEETAPASRARLQKVLKIVRP